MENEIQELFNKQHNAIWTNMLGDISFHPFGH